MSKKFYLGIFNKIFEFNNHEIMIIFDKKGEAWFSFKKLLIALGYTDLKNIVTDFNIDDKYKKKFDKIKIPVMTPVLYTNNKRVHPSTVFVNELGLYKILLKSDKPLAKQFSDKYVKEIMPTITKTGKYISSKDDQDKINKLNDKIKNLTKENNYLDNKYRFKPSPNGYLYICETECIIKGKKIKCYA